MSRLSGLRLALVALLVALGVVAVVLGAGGRDRSSEPAGGVSAIDQAIRDDLVARTPRAVLSTCRSATAGASMAARCPAVIPLPDDGWGRGRALDNSPCEYLIDLQAGPGARGVPTRVWHLLFGGRCEPFDLAVSDGRWPTRGFIERDLRLVGVRPGNDRRPARARVLERFRIAGRPALLLRHRAQPLTTVHSGHLAIVWNEASAGYAVSGHPPDAPTPGGERDAIRALRITALGMHLRPPSP
jgi:hypothetical protein